MILYLLLFLTFALMVGASLLLPFVTSIQYQKRNRFQLKQAQHFPIWMVVLVEFRRRVVFLLDFIVHYIHEKYTMKPLELNPKVGEYGKLDVEIVKPSSKDEQTFGMLSPTDAPFPPSHYCFQFEGFLDRKLLVESLSEVLKYIPRLGSKLIQFKSLDELKRETSGWFDELSTMERRIVEGRLLQANKPITLFDLRNVQLEVCFAEDDTIKTHEETGLLTATDLAKNMHILSVFGVRGPLKVIHSEPTDPLTRLQVTYLRKSNKTALTVYMDHAVGDASSMSMLMQLLGDILSSKQTGKEFKPRNLPVANPVPIFKFGYNKEAEKLDDFLFTYYDPTACYSFFRAEVFKYLDQNSKNPAKIIAKEITVNKKQLEQLKKKIVTETPELTDVAFSTNDMLNVLLLRAVAFGDKINRVASEKLLTLRYVASFRERCDYITSNYFGNAFGIIFNSVSKKDLLEKTTGELILMAKKNSEKTVHNQGYWETKLEEMNQRYFDPLQVDYGFPAFEGIENFMGVTNWVKPMLDIGSHFQDKSYLGISTLCMPFPHVNKILPTSTTDPNGGVRLVLSLYEPEYLYFVGEIPKI